MKYLPHVNPKIVPAAIACLALFVLVGGSTKSAFAQTNTFPASGNVGVGTTAPATSLHVATESVAPTRGIVGAQSSNDVSGSMFSFWKSRGTIASPTVIGSGDSIGNIYSYGYDGSSYISGGKLKFVVDGAVTTGTVPTSFQLYTGNNGGGVERLRVTAAGFFGIGTSAPATALHLATESTGPRGITNSQHSADVNGSILAFRKSRGSIAAPAVAVNGDSIGNLYAEGYDGSSYISGGRIRFLIDGPVSAGVVPTSVQFFSGTGNFGGIERMRINSSGNVGIGTTSPAFDANTARYLTVDGGAGVVGSIGAAGGTGSAATAVGQFAFVNSNLGTAEKRVATIVGSTDAATNSGLLDFYVASAGAFSIPRLRINSSGNIGIGTATPGYRLDVQGGALNSSGGLCIAGDCKTAWSQVGGTSQWTTQSANIYFNTGKVGIGTTTPAGKLHVVSGTDAGTALLNLDTGVHGGTQMVVFGTPNNESGFDMSVYRGGAYVSRLGVNATGEVYLQSGAGNVGIGTSTPNSSYKLDVNGHTNVTGNLNVTGNIAAKYQDVAEWVHSSQQLAAGTVVVLDHTKSNQVIASSQAYDTRVAGVISLQPGIALGEDGAGKVLVATTGRVKVKVDATAGPIQVGDLLVTSDKEGFARRSEPLSLGGVAIHRPGTLIGKALESLEQGTGEILVLLSLQ